MDRIKKLTTSLNISNIQNEAQSIPALDLLSIRDEDVYAMDSYEQMVRNLYRSFLAELKMSGIVGFDCGFLPFNVNDGSVNTFDVTMVTVSDFINLIDKARQIEDAQGTTGYEKRTSWRALVELCNILCRATVTAVDNHSICSGHPAEQRDCYKLLFMPLGDYLELYNETLTIVYDDPSEIIIRLSDVPKLQRWVFDNKSDMVTISSGMPVASMISALVDCAKAVDFGAIDGKDPQYIYEFMNAVVFNLFGYFQNI